MVLFLVKGLGEESAYVLESADDTGEEVIGRHDLVSFRIVSGMIEEEWCSSYTGPGGLLPPGLRTGEKAGVCKPSIQWDAHRALTWSGALLEAHNDLLSINLALFGSLSVEEEAR